MRKILMGILVVLSLVLMPISVDAKSDEVIIYLFRGDGCHVCEEALEYINAHKDEIGDGIRLATLEVWRNSNNSNLQDKVADYLEVDKDDNYGTPFFVIGSEYVKGYGGSATFTELLEIAKKYQSGEEEYTDVVEKVRKDNNISTRVLYLEDLYSEPNKVVTIIVYSIFGIIVLGIGAMIVFSRK